MGTCVYACFMRDRAFCATYSGMHHAIWQQLMQARHDKPLKFTLCWFEALVDYEGRILLAFAAISGALLAT